MHGKICTGRVAARDREAAHRAVRQIERRVGCHQFGDGSGPIKIRNATSNSAVDFHRQICTVAIQIIDVAQRVRRQIVDAVIRSIEVQIMAKMPPSIEFAAFQLEAERLNTLLSPLPP